MTWVKALHDAVRLVCHLLVQVLALVIVGVDLQGHAVCTVRVALHEQRHGLATVLYAAAGIDARTYLEDDIVHRHLAFTEAANLDNGLQAHTGVGINLS